MYNRINHFLAEYNILSNKQYGFRRNYSTYMAMIDLVDKISSNIDHKNHNIGIFLDLSKAFDTIDHNILLKKTSVLWYKRHSLRMVQKLP